MAARVGIPSILYKGREESPFSENKKGSQITPPFLWKTASFSLNFKLVSNCLLQ